MIAALIFDKDGTLFDFTASWATWVQLLLPHLTQDAQTRRRICAAIGFDPVLRRFDPASIVIAGTTPQIADVVHPFVPHMSLDTLNTVMSAQASLAPMQPAVDLPLVLGGFRRAGLRLGLATNDTEAPARAHLARAGVADLFDFVAGCDSGFGAKPAPGQLLEFARRCALAPQSIAMVGDSLHDLHAAAAAGMRAIAVLTGVAPRATLAPYADVVLPDIGHIADWMANP